MRSKRGSQNALERRPPRLDLDEARPSPPQQRRSIEKRDRLLRAARQVFEERGFEAASIEQITSRAEVAVGAFYLYFGSKRQLLVDLMTDLLERLGRMKLEPPVGGDMRKALRSFLSEALTADRENYGVIKAWFEAVASDPELGRMQSRIERWTEARVHAVLRRVQQHPHARRGVSLIEFARVIDRNLWMLLSRAGALSRTELESESAVISDIIYYYLIVDV